MPPQLQQQLGGVAHGNEVPHAQSRYRGSRRHLNDIDDTPVVVADGYGIKVRVSRRHLTVEDGIGNQRRTRRLHKATSGITRLVVLGHTGYITLEALRWLLDANAALIHLDPDGRLVTSSEYRGRDIPALRRAQSLASTNAVGIEITRELLRRKLDGQAQTAALLPGAEQDTIDSLGEAGEALDTASDLSHLASIEADAAALYWQAWSSQRVQFVAADRADVPDHWHTVGNRRSPISRSNRLAANPAQAILNYLYGILEAETIVGCATVGLDPGLGFLHTDQPHRANLALDIMEVGRPQVDRLVLDLLDSHAFRAHDFHETRRGACRVLAPLTHSLASSARLIAEACGPAIELVATRLAGTAGLTSSPTPLTQTNRRTSRARTESTSSARGARLSVPDHHCVDCGTSIRTGNKRCAGCNRQHQGTRINAAAIESLDSMRRDGKDPAHGGDAARKRAAAITRQADLRRSWDPNGQLTDPVHFKEHLLPRLSTVPISDLAEATGLSAGYCSMIRRGLRTPHPRHWETLSRLISSDY